VCTPDFMSKEKFFVKSMTVSDGSFAATLAQICIFFAVAGECGRRSVCERVCMVMERAEGQGKTRGRTTSLMAMLYVGVVLKLQHMYATHHTRT
jgi:hypothetical protein